MLHPVYAGACRGWQGAAAAAASAHVYWFKLMTHSPFLHHAMLDKYMHTSNLTYVNDGLPAHEIAEEDLGLDEDTATERDTSAEDTVRCFEYPDSLKLDKCKDTNGENQLNGGFIAQARDGSIINLTKLFRYNSLEPTDINDAEKKLKNDHLLAYTKSVSECRMSRSQKIYAYNLSGDDDDFAAAGDNVKLPPKVDLFDHKMNRKHEWKSRHSSIISSKCYNRQGNYVTQEKDTYSRRSVVETKTSRGSSEICEYQTSEPKNKSLNGALKKFNLVSLLPSNFFEFSKCLARKTMSICTSFSKCSRSKVKPKTNPKEIKNESISELTAPLDQQHEIEKETLYLNLPQTNRVNSYDPFDKTDLVNNYPYSFLKCDRESMVNFIKDTTKIDTSSSEDRRHEDQLLSTQYKKSNEFISNTITDIVSSTEEIKKLNFKSANVSLSDLAVTTPEKENSYHDIVNKDNFIEVEIKYSMNCLNEFVYDSSSATESHRENQTKHDGEITPKSTEQFGVKDLSLESINDISNYEKAKKLNGESISKYFGEKISCLSGSMNNLLLYDLPDIMHTQQGNDAVTEPEVSDSTFNITDVISDTSRRASESFDKIVNKVSKNFESLRCLHNFISDKSSLSKLKPYQEILDMKSFTNLASEEATTSLKLPSNDHFLWEYYCDNVRSTGSSQFDFVSNKSSGTNMPQHQSPSLLSCEGSRAVMAYNLETFIKSKYDNNERHIKPKTVKDPRLEDSRLDQGLQRSKFDSSNMKRKKKHTCLRDQSFEHRNTVLDQPYCTETHKKTATSCNFRSESVFFKPLDKWTRVNSFGRDARSVSRSREENDFTVNKLKGSNTVTFLNCDPKLFDTTHSRYKVPHQHRKKANSCHKKLPEVRCEYYLPYDSDESAVYYNGYTNDVNGYTNDVNGYINDVNGYTNNVNGYTNYTNNVNPDKLIDRKFDDGYAYSEKIEKKDSREPFAYDKISLQIPALNGTTKRSRVQSKGSKQRANTFTNNSDQAEWEELTRQFKDFEKHLRTKRLNRQLNIIANNMKEPCDVLANERRRLVSTYVRTNEDVWWSESDSQCDL